MRNTIQFFILVVCLPFLAVAKDVTRIYTFPDNSFTVTFPCIGLLDISKSSEDTYDMVRANMTCDQKGLTYTAQYFKFHNIEGMKTASLQDKHYFLREFRDMVRKIYMGDYDDFMTENETKTSVAAFPALRFDLVSDKEKKKHIKISSQALLDQNNALYLSSMFVKDKENIYNIKEFFGSVKKGSK